MRYVSESNEVRFYRCKHCGNMIIFLKNMGVPVTCCGQKMDELIPGTIEASLEKHIPVYQVRDNVVEVTIGAIEHPMVPEHYIEWIFLKTRFGQQWKNLRPGDAPKACFSLCDGDEVEVVYAYCNLHGLWKTL